MAIERNNRLVKIASYASVTTAVIIMLAKSYAWLATESQSILASLIDSLLDISSSVINLIAIRVSLLPADDNHRFGHEKFQDLAIFSQSMFFFASCLFTLFSSSKSLFSGSELVNLELGANVMYFCVFLTFILVCFQSYVISKTKSKIISADKLHYFSDFITNIAVIISIYLSATFWYIDALAGISISLYVMYASYRLFREAIRNLADEELPQKEKDKILSIVSNYNQVKGIHELKTRYAASKPFIQFHLELDGNITLYRSHEMADKLMKDLLQEFPEAEITIHQDPAGLEQDVNYREKI
jgi:cation diffusion facilitator family transporter